MIIFLLAMLKKKSFNVACSHHVARESSQKKKGAFIRLFFGGGVQPGE